jgi:hypothetical protein
MLPIFPGAPWLIAHRSMLGVNRPYKVTLNSQDYVLWQDVQGQVYALDNICPHMQAPLSEGYFAKVEQTFIRENNTLKEILANPALLSTPQTYRSNLEYTFPSTTMFNAEVDFGQIPQFYILYPETERRTKTFVLCYGEWKNPLFRLPGLNLLAKNALLKATATVVEQDSATLESLYPQQKTKIRLPKEEIMVYVEKLYREWQPRE